MGVLIIRQTEQEIILAKCDKNVSSELNFCQATRLATWRMGHYYGTVYQGYKPTL